MHSTWEIVNRIIKGYDKKHAANKLNCSRRWLNVLIKRFDPNNQTCYSHKNRNRVPANKISQAIVDRVVWLKQNKYPHHFSIQHFHECLMNIENIKISVSTIKNILKQNNIITNFSHQRNKRQSIKNNGQHCLIMRTKKFGDIVEADACKITFLNGLNLYLHLIVDRATSKILAAHFDTRETLIGYYNILRRMIINYGVPLTCIVDHREIHHRNTDRVKEPKLPQLNYVCQNLGIKLIATSIPQEKPVVERLLRLVKTRLIAEFSLVESLTIERANELLSIHIAKINQLKNYDESSFPSAFTKANDDWDWNLFFALRYPRKILKGNVLSFQQQYYQPFLCNEKIMKNFAVGASGLVMITLNDKILWSTNKEIYTLVKYNKYENSWNNHQPFELTDENSNSSWTDYHDFK